MGKRVKSNWRNEVKRDTTSYSKIYIKMTIICNNFCLICVKRAGGQEVHRGSMAHRGKKRKKEQEMRIDHPSLQVF